MKIRVLAVGTRMPAWVQTGVAEYQKRLPRDWHFEWVELPLGSRGKSQASTQSNQRAVAAEGRAMLSVIKPQDRVIALDVDGKAWSSEQLAQQLNHWQLQGQDVCLLIGGPEGLSQECLNAAAQHWSLSTLTLPHPLVRIVLIEQLYRGWSLLNNHPYHK